VCVCVCVCVCVLYRNQALGVAAFVGRLGGMLAPFMTDLVSTEEIFMVTVTRNARGQPYKRCS